MLASYFESIKYVGHMWPVAFVRIVLGYQSLSLVVNRVQMGYLEHATISERLNLSEGDSSAPSLYFELFKNLIQSQWLVMTYILLGVQIVIGISYIFGFGVRVASVLGMILSLHAYLFFDAQFGPGQLYLFYIHLLFCLIGAGRCLGLDYYMFKSRRGLFW